MSSENRNRTLTARTRVQNRYYQLIKVDSQYERSMKYTCSLGTLITHGVVSSNRVYDTFILFVTVLNYT